MIRIYNIWGSLSTRITTCGTFSIIINFIAYILVPREDAGKTMQVGMISIYVLGDTVLFEEAGMADQAAIYPTARHDRLFRIFAEPLSIYRERRTITFFNR